MPSWHFFKGGGTRLLQILLNNRKISLSPQEPGTCTHRNTFLTGARLLVVTAGPGSGGRRCSWCRCSVTRLHHNTSTGSTNTTARVSQTRAAQHATTPHTAHNTVHTHTAHTPYTHRTPHTRCWRQGPCPRSCARPAAAAAHWWCVGAAPAETLRPGTSPAAGGGWPATQPSTAQHSSAGQQRK